jgi:hypothetical protein
MSVSQSILAFIKDFIFSLVQLVKICATIGGVIYLWTYTCENRNRQFGVIHELAKDNFIKITYHHDRVSADSSFEHRNNGEIDLHENETQPPQDLEDCLKKDAGDYQKDIVTDEEYRLKHPEEEQEDRDGNPLLHLSEDVYKAITELVHAEFGDKTFCLIIIFTISWTNWNSPSSDDSLVV